MTIYKYKTLKGIRQAFEKTKARMRALHTKAQSKLKDKWK